MEHDSIVDDNDVFDSASTEKKHSVTFLLNSSSSSSLPCPPLSSSSTATTTTSSSYSTPRDTAHSPPSSRLVVMDDMASCSTRAESESAPFDELLTAAYLLETNSRARITDLASPIPLAIHRNTTSMADSNVVLHKGVVESTTGSRGICVERSDAASSSAVVVGSGRVIKRRKKRASVACDECGRLFGEAAAVRKHKRVVHLKVKDFECNICSRKFAEKSNLKKHQTAVHQQTRAHKCSECDKVFNFTDGLRRHFNNCHLGLRPYECDMCSSSFKQRTHLQKHRQSVHNMKSAPKSESQSLVRTVATHFMAASDSGSNNVMNSATKLQTSTSVPSSSD